MAKHIEHELQTMRSEGSTCLGRGGKITGSSLYLKLDDLRKHPRELLQTDLRDGVVRHSFLERSSTCPDECLELFLSVAVRPFVCEEQDGEEWSVGSGLNICVSTMAAAFRGSTHNICSLRSGQPHRQVSSEAVLQTPHTLADKALSRLGGPEGRQYWLRPRYNGCTLHAYRALLSGIELLSGDPLSFTDLEDK